MSTRTTVALLAGMGVLGLGAGNASAQSLGDIANQLLRPQQGPNQDQVARDAYERGRADAARDQQNRDGYRDDRRRPFDDRRREDDRRRGDDDRHRPGDDDRRRPGDDGYRRPADGYAPRDDGYRPPASYGR